MGYLVSIDVEGSKGYYSGAKKVRKGLAKKKRSVLGKVWNYEEARRESCKGVVLSEGLFTVGHGKARNEGTYARLLALKGRCMEKELGARAMLRTKCAHSCYVLSMASSAGRRVRVLGRGCCDVDKKVDGYEEEEEIKGSD
ncbi:unnamed protein product [Dovyalis caffra]|uniref:Uncharacterized protein n=1 Tax=Dovyalis caffra TaxID=77055 RepID=A0AAV1STH4_9ROSI|nr:unnamed protein product [Dovyalis caffra]